MTFTCLYGTYDFKNMTFGQCNVPATFQYYMMAIFYDILEEFFEVFISDCSNFGNSFEVCMENLDKARSVTFCLGKEFSLAMKCPAVA